MSLTCEDLEEINQKLLHGLQVVSAENEQLHRENARLSAALEHATGQLMRMHSRYGSFTHYVRTLREWLRARGI